MSDSDDESDRKLSEELSNAVRAFDDSKLSELLKQEKYKKIIDVAVYKFNGKPGTALGWACFGGRSKSARLLLEAGADTAAADNEALNFAIKENRIECIDILIEAGVDKNSNFVSKAIRSGQYEVAKHLVRKGFSVKWTGHWQDLSPLVIACEHKNEDMVKFLLLHGAPLKGKDFTVAVTYDYIDHAAAIRFFKAIVKKMGGQEKVKEKAEKRRLRRKNIEKKQEEAQENVEKKQEEAHSDAKFFSGFTHMAAALGALGVIHPN